MSSSIKGIVFDFDGVILESADVKTDAFVDLYSEHGPDVVAQVRAHHLANLGISRFKKFEWIAEHVLNESLSEQQSRALGERFSALALDKVLSCPYVPGALDALEALQGHYALFVASGTPRDELALIVERRGLSPYFIEVHGSPAEKVDVLRGAASKLLTSCHDLLMVGDGLSDHAAATAVGARFLARDTPALHDEWVRLGVHRTPDLTALVNIVTAW